jgi:osmotically-inducible protein OsmY
LSAAGLAGCDQVDTSPPVAAPSATPAPDNSGVNQRDANRDATKTPIDQNENQADIDRTAEIRKRIVDTPDMSIDGQNVKVITANGKVTLRGPVNSEAERDTIAKIATAVAGEGNVDNQLEVKPPKP